MINTTKLKEFESVDHYNTWVKDKVGLMVTTIHINCDHVVAQYTYDANDLLLLYDNLLKNLSMEIENIMMQCSINIDEDFECVVSKNNWYKLVNTLSKIQDLRKRVND